MKRILMLFFLLLAFSFAAFAEGNSPKDTTGTEDRDSTVITATTTATTTGEAAVTLHNSKPISHKSGIPGLWEIVALSVAVIALGLAIVLFFSSRKKIRELKRRTYKLKEAIETLKFNHDQLATEFDNKLSSKLALNQSHTEEAISGLKQQILSLSQARQQEPVPARGELGPRHHEPKTFYGVYKPRFNGVPAEDVTDYPEGGSTFVITAISENSATFQLIDRISKTQFASLNMNPSAVEVTSGNPQSYERIVPEEAGTMTLEYDVWKIVRKVKVKLV